MFSAAKGMKTAMFGKKDEAGKRQDEQQMKEKRFLQIRKEVEKLQDKVLVAREKYERENQGGIAVAAPCKVSHSFRLEAEESCYILSVECEHPIDLIAMRADVHMDLLDHGTSGVVMSRTEGPPNEVLVNYKFQEPTMRHEIRFRTIEGMGGTCSCFVVPTVKPKCAMLVKVDILPLSLHDKVQESQIADRENIPVNELRLSGQFSLADMNMWLASCLDVPTRPEREDVQLWYKNTFTGSMLECRFSAGQAVFRSDSISTVAVLKEIMTKEATDRKIHLKISCDVNKETFPFFLNNLHPKLAYQHSLTNKVQVVEPLKEISLQENGDTSFLSPELALVLEKHEELLAAFEEQPRRLLFLYNIVCGLYRNKWKMLGHANVDHRIPDLEELLHAYSLETLLQFFEEPLQ
jgi:Bardet-Biedl syndrome 7 protein